MVSIDRWYYEDTGEPYHYPKDTGGRELYTIVECLRKNCNIQAIAFISHDSLELLNEWQHLPEDPERKVIAFPTDRMQCKRVV